MSTVYLLTKLKLDVSIFGSTLPSLYTRLLSLILSTLCPVGVLDYAFLSEVLRSGFFFY